MRVGGDVAIPERTVDTLESQRCHHVRDAAHLRAHLLEVMIRDQAILVPVAGVLIVMLLAFLFRSFRGVAVPSIAAVAPALMLFGIMG